MIFPFVIFLLYLMLLTYRQWDCNPINGIVFSTARATTSHLTPQSIFPTLQKSSGAHQDGFRRGRLCRPAHWLAIPNTVTCKSQDMDASARSKTKVIKKSCVGVTRCHENWWAYDFLVSPPIFQVFPPVYSIPHGGEHLEDGGRYQKIVCVLIFVTISFPGETNFCTTVIPSTLSITSFFLRRTRTSFACSESYFGWNLPKSTDSSSTRSTKLHHMKIIELQWHLPSSTDDHWISWHERYQFPMKFTELSHSRALLHTCSKYTGNWTEI